MKLLSTIKLFFICFAGICILFSCRKAYEPDVSKVNYKYLVVDGVINTGANPTDIRISRTWPVGSDTTDTPETNAFVRVEDQNSNTTFLYENQPGVYHQATGNFSNQVSYRLHINTSDGQEYVSDYVKGIATPAIDSVNWSRKEDGVHIYVSTHDPLSAANYYRWDFEETWEYKSFYQSTVKYVNGVFVGRTPAEDVFTCWHSLASTEILLGSSTGLSNTIIYEKPITFIPIATERIGLRYSILVKQYAMDQAAYQYFEQLKKNSEQLGTIFGNEPSKLTGNIHNVSNPNEPVLGFLSAGDMQQNRIFISNDQVPLWGYEKTGCEVLVVTPDKFESVFGHGGYLPISQHGLVDYTGASNTCVDCTLAGGTNVKPNFW